MDEACLPVSQGGSSSEKEGSAILSTPGEGGEPAVAIQLGPPQEVQIRDTARNYHMSRVARS